MNRTKTFSQNSDRLILCGTCPHFQTLCKGQLCKKSRGWLYLPKHLISCVLGFGFTPTKVFLKSNNAKIRFQFSNRPHITFSINCFCNGREVKLNAGISLWMNPTIHKNFSTFRSDTVFRFYRETKPSATIRNWFEQWLRTGTITIQESDFRIAENQSKQPEKLS